MKTIGFSFLFLYVACAQLYLGSLTILCFRALIPSRWIEPLAPALLRAQKAGWPLALLFLVLVALAPQVFPWAAVPVEGNAFRRLYLSLPVFTARGVFCWGSWLLLARAARRRARYAGGPGMVLILLTGTLAATDWVLSLENEFGSTIFGLVFLLSSLLVAFAFAVAFRAPSTEQERQDQGSVHFAILCTWTYLSFMQFLVIWSGNLPHEVIWFARRSAHGWGWIPAVAALAQFFVPFLLLLQKSVKRSAPASRALAFSTIGLQTLLLFWQILPALREKLSLSLSDAVAFLLFAAAVVWLGKERRARA